MSLGTILLIILVIVLLGGFSGFGGGPFYGTGYYGGGGLGHTKAAGSATPRLRAPSGISALRLMMPFPLRNRWTSELLLGRSGSVPPEHPRRIDTNRAS
jgi:hypothetical protein